MLRYLALAIIILLICAVAAVIIFLGSLPGKIALRRGHPWPAAVNAASWIGLATGVFWPVAFIWAFLPVPQRVGETGEPDGDRQALAARVAALERAVEQLRSQSREGAA